MEQLQLTDYDVPPFPLGKPFGERQVLTHENPPTLPLTA